MKNCSQWWRSIEEFHRTRKCRRWLDRNLGRVRLPIVSQSRETVTVRVELVGGGHDLVFSTPGGCVNVMGVSDLVRDDGRLPQSLLQSLLMRNSQLQGCSWSLLDYGRLQMCVIVSNLGRLPCCRRRFQRSLENIVQELEHCRTTLNSFKVSQGY